MKRAEQLVHRTARDQTNRPQSSARKLNGFFSARMVPNPFSFKSGRHWMSLNYIVSAKKASVVTDAVVGNFTGDEDMNLILAKVNRLEIVKLASDGLKVVQEVPVFGRIETIRLFRPKGE
ncbi:hypothetical protein ANCDUO_26517, partial [Ancylostoma duodenale]